MTPANICSTSFFFMGSVLAYSSYNESLVSPFECSFSNQTAHEFVGNAYSGFSELFFQYVQNPFRYIRSPSLLDVQMPSQDLNEGDIHSLACLRLKKKFNLGLISMLTPAAIFVIHTLKHLK